MSKRFLSVLLALTLLLSLSTTVLAAEPDSTKTVTTFNGSISISNVVKKGDIKTDKSFNQAEVDQALEISDNFHPEYGTTELYYSSAPTTITINEVDDGNYCIYSWVFCYLDDDHEPTFDVSKGYKEVYRPEYDDNEVWLVFSGTITLDKPGTYYMYAANCSLSDDNYESGIYFVVGDSAAPKATPTPTPTPTPAPATPAPAPAVTATANPTLSKVYVDDKLVQFDAYTINGNNYFKLRDLAKVLNGTGVQFEVTWDGAKNAINLITWESYTPVGGELAMGDGKAKTATLSTSTIYMDGKQIALTAYTINGNNYFKLRDIGEALNFGVTWDGATNSIIIDTSVTYY